MTRNLKAFGLALVAAVALGAIGAQAASAVVEHSFRSDLGETVLTGANESYSTGSSRDVATLTAGLTIECDATYEGISVGTTVDTLTIHPTYSSCANGVTITTKGCNYILDTDTTQSAGHSASSEHASISLECESAHSGSPHAIEAKTPACNFAWTVTTPGGTTVNQSLHGVRYSNLNNHSGKNAGTGRITVRTISYTAKAGSFCGLAGHPAGSYGNGSYDGLATVTGYAVGSVVSGSTTNGTVWSHGAQTNITISSPT